MKLIQTLYPAATAMGILLNVSGVSVLLGRTDTQVAERFGSASYRFIDRATGLEPSAQVAMNEFELVAQGESLR